MIQCEVVNDELILHSQFESKRNDGLMQHTPKVYWPLIQCKEVDDELLWHSQNRNKGHGRLRQHAHKARWPPI
eukprot:10364842-Ditylum_brightwellii.AAC.1